ncbi:MAG TPA: FecR domain-containing protein [Gemmatimonadaceae bacterium]|nr:FecR domain-containing protein [Gemmatimonadaceae bacterium]
MNNNPSTPIDWEAIARFLAGESSPAESERVARWLDEHAADAELVAALDKAMATLVLPEAADVDVEGALRTVIARRDAPVPIKERKKRNTRTTVSPWRMVTLLAAAAVVILAARALLERKGNATTSPPIVGGDNARVFTTAVGKRDSVHLRDGGRVILGPGSQLIVAAGYGVDQRVREVELHGEAYFDVVHDTTRPFLVRAGKAMVRDVGTSFDVRNDSGSRVRVVVTSGSVTLSSTASADSIVLSAGDVGAVQTDGRVSAQHGTPIASYLAWMRDSLIFREAPMSEVSSNLRRWYGVSLHIEDSALARRHLTMTLAGDPLDRVLRMIGLELGADVERRGDSAIVRPLTGSPRTQ